MVGVVVVRCPTGCGPLRRPFALRAVAVRCENCTAWFSATRETEDGSLVEGLLLARPGERLPTPARRRVAPRAWLVAAVLALAASAAALAGIGLH